MRRIRYSVAASLDGYIAGPRGDVDWIPMDPDIDFGELFAEFDTLLIGRRTYEVMLEASGPETPGMRKVVASRTLKPEEHPDVTIVGENLQRTIAELRAAPGKDIWLFGGGVLFRSLLEMGEVDGVEVAIVPVLLGGGTPLLPPSERTVTLELVDRRTYPKSGIVLLDYRVIGIA